jgi:hypothetical protein
MRRETEIEIKSGRGRVLQPLLLIATIGVGLAVGATAGRAGEPSTLCTGFCAPVAARQLESTRGAGSDTQVGVILWDELRRQAAPPPPPPSNAGDDAVTVHGPGSIILAGAKPH